VSVSVSVFDDSLGDSTLDNKFWFADGDAAVNGYELLLQPPVSRMDIAYWINQVLVQRRIPHYAAINCAGMFVRIMYQSLNEH
jgi:hypothetical protein